MWAFVFIIKFIDSLFLNYQYLFSFNHHYFSIIIIVNFLFNFLKDIKNNLNMNHIKKFPIQFINPKFIKIYFYHLWINFFYLPNYHRYLYHNILIRIHVQHLFLKNNLHQLFLFYIFSIFSKFMFQPLLIISLWRIIIQKVIMNQFQKSYLLLYRKHWVQWIHEQIPY